METGFFLSSMRKKPIEADLYQLYSELDLRNLLDQLAEMVRFHLQCQEAAIFLYNSDKNELYFESVTGEKGDILKQITLKRGEGIAGWVAEHRLPLSIPDCAHDPRFSARSDSASSFHTRSILAVPVLADNSLIGVLEGINKQDGHFDADDEQVLAVVARYTAVPLQNALLFHRLRRQSTEKDILLRLAREIAVAARFDDLFPSLLELISSQSDTVSIRLLLSTAAGKTIRYSILEPARVEESPIPYRFPFQSSRGQSGALDIVCRHPLSEPAQILFAGLAGYIALLADKLDMLAERIRSEKIEKELEIARGIQQSFLIPSPPLTPGLECCFINLTSSKVGGDYYDLIPLPDRHLLFTIADIAGHGVPASLLMAIYRTNFRYRALRDSSVQETVTKINNLIAETTDPSQYLTTICGNIDLSAMSLAYINAGHPPAVLLRGSDYRLLESNNTTVGMFAAMNFVSHSVAIQPGDLLFLYTDGLVESENGRGRQFGLERCVKTIQQIRNNPLPLVRDRLLAKLAAFHRSTAYEDDITLLLIRVAER